MAYAQAPDVCPFFCTRCQFNATEATSMGVYRFVYVCRRNYGACERYAQHVAAAGAEDASAPEPDRSVPR